MHNMPMSMSSQQQQQPRGQQSLPTLQQQQTSHSSSLNRNINMNNSIPPSMAPALMSMSRSNEEFVKIPLELQDFVSEPQFKHILLRVKEQSKINYVNTTLHKDTGRPDSIMIDGPTAESALVARKLIELHFTNHLKIVEAENRLHRVKTDLFSAQGEMASGMICDFTINPDLVGVAIGKKGSRIKQIEQLTGVTSINVDGQTG